MAIKVDLVYLIFDRFLFDYLYLYQIKPSSNNIHKQYIYNSSYDSVDDSGLFIALTEPFIHSLSEPVWKTYNITAQRKHDHQMSNVYF